LHETLIASSKTNTSWVLSSKCVKLVSKNNNPKIDSIWVADLLGDVSGAIKATPSLEAAR